MAGGRRFMKLKLNLSWREAEPKRVDPNAHKSTACGIPPGPGPCKAPSLNLIGGPFESSSCWRSGGEQGVDN